MWNIKCILKCYLHWCSGNWNRILASDRPHPLGMTKEARSGTSAAYRFPSTTSMRSSAVESLRRVMSALWILYSARMLFTVSASSSVCAHWREKKGGEGVMSINTTEWEDESRTILYISSISNIIHFSHCTADVMPPVRYEKSTSAEMSCNLLHVHLRAAMTFEYL